MTPLCHPWQLHQATALWCNLLPKTVTHLEGCGELLERYGRGMSWEEREWYKVRGGIRRIVLRLPARSDRRAQPVGDPAYCSTRPTAPRSLRTNSPIHCVSHYQASVLVCLSVSAAPSLPILFSQRPPSSVVKEDRGKAIAVWVLLLSAFIAYVVYLGVNSVEMRKNPPVQILRKVFQSLKNNVACKNIRQNRGRNGSLAIFWLGTRKESEQFCLVFKPMNNLTWNLSERTTPKYPEVSVVLDRPRQSHGPRFLNRCSKPIWRRSRRHIVLSRPAVFHSHNQQDEPFKLPDVVLCPSAGDGCNGRDGGSDCLPMNWYLSSVEVRK